MLLSLICYIKCYIYDILIHLMKHRQTRYCWLLLCIVWIIWPHNSNHKDYHGKFFFGILMNLGIYHIFFLCLLNAIYALLYNDSVSPCFTSATSPGFRTCRHPASAFCARAGIMKWHRGCKGWQHLFQAVHHIFNLVAVEVGTTDDDHLLLPSSTPQVPRS